MMMRPVSVSRSRLRQSAPAGAPSTAAEWNTWSAMTVGVPTVVRSA